MWGVFSSFCSTLFLVPFTLQDILWFMKLSKLLNFSLHRPHSCESSISSSSERAKSRNRATQYRNVPLCPFVHWHYPKVYIQRDFVSKNIHWSCWLLFWLLFGCLVLAFLFRIPLSVFCWLLLCIFLFYKLAPLRIIFMTIL